MTTAMTRKARMGMIGGGQGAFIGVIHRQAALMDGLIELVCGAFSSDPQRSLDSGRALFLPDSRVYPGFEEMIRREAELPPDHRMDFVSIVTPNNMHFGPAKMALEHGFDVIIDKPVTFTLAEAKALREVVRGTGRTLAITQTYAGYPMVKQAREMVHSGMFGAVRKVYVEYPQGWLNKLLEGTGNKQADWRTDPSRNGIAGGMGDIGTHAFHMAEYVTGLRVTKICADLNIYVPGRKLDDDGAVLLRFDNGASGVLTASQICAGEENNLKIRVYGELGGIEWQQEDCNSLQVKWADRPKEIYRAGTAYIGPLARHNTRTPAGHPEAYIEAFANIYRNFVHTLVARAAGQEPPPEVLDFAGIEDGIRGMAFIENVIASSRTEHKWTEFTVD